MSKSPWTRPVSWKVELGVLTIFTSTPWRAKKPCDSPAHSGQLKPPGNTITFSSCAAPWAGAAVGASSAAAAARARKIFISFMAASFEDVGEAMIRARPARITRANPDRRALEHAVAVPGLLRHELQHVPVLYH